MSTPLKIALIVILIAVGPAMFVVSRGHSLIVAFDKINVGDSAETVVATMGRPQSQARANLYLHGDTEYRYSVWPIPQLWVVSLKDGKVVEKAAMQSP
jgi:hypothetical protein